MYKLDPKKYNKLHNKKFILTYRETHPLNAINGELIWFVIINIVLVSEEYWLTKT